MELKSGTETKLEKVETFHIISTKDNRRLFYSIFIFFLGNGQFEPFKRTLEQKRSVDHFDSRNIRFFRKESR